MKPASPDPFAHPPREPHTPGPPAWPYLWWELLDRRQRDRTLAEAERELVRVQRFELAGLLAQAARLRAGSAPFGFVADTGLPPADAGAWRQRAQRALEGLALRDADVPLDRLRAGLWNLHQGPGASELASTALAFEPAESHRLTLAVAFLAEGRWDLALERGVELLRRDPPPALRWQGLLVVALAHEQRGNDRLALGASTAAGALPGCGPGPSVLQLFLALMLGDVRAAQGAALRVQRQDPTAASFRRELQRLGLRLDVFRGGRPWSPPRASVPLLGAWRSGPAGGLASFAQLVEGGSAS